MPPSSATDRGRIPARRSLSSSSRPHRERSRRRQKCRSWIRSASRSDRRCCSCEPGSRSNSATATIRCTTCTSRTRKRANRRSTSRSPPTTAYTYTFQKDGFYRVGCDIHPAMAASVFSVSTPYVTLAEPDGRFTIADVAPGAYTATVYTAGRTLQRAVEATERRRRDHDRVAGVSRTKHVVVSAGA